MFGVNKKGERLSLSQKLSRLAGRMRDPEWRRYAGLLLGGKALGIGLVLLIITVVSGLFFTHVFSQTPAPRIKDAGAVNPINTPRAPLAALPGFGMHGGFTLVEAGL